MTEKNKFCVHVWVWDDVYGAGYCKICGQTSDNIKVGNEKISPKVRVEDVITATEQQENEKHD